MSHLKAENESPEPKGGIPNDEIWQGVARPEPISEGKQQVSRPCELATALHLCQRCQGWRAVETAKFYRQDGVVLGSTMLQPS